jgi:ATP-dependent Clp protease, protease subunit
MRRYESRESRFSARTLLSYAAASLPETLAVVAATDDAPAEILLYDEIGFWGTNAADFAKALSAAGDGPLTLRINSPGGDVFDGYAIYNMLRARSAPVSVVVDGIAASAASFIAMAGTTVTMGEPSMLMIHNCWGLCIGDRNDMLDMAATQEKIDGQIAVIYATKAGKPVTDMAAAMDTETWYTSTEAKAAGLCDVVLTAPPATVARAKAKAAVPVKPKANAPLNAPRAAYDPDGDGDDDAAEAIGLIQKAMGSLTDAIEALNGTEDDTADASARRRPRAAATAPEWQCGAAEDLAVDDSGAWDGPAAAERILDAAGFNGNSPDPAKAKRGFLAWDHHNPKLKGSYKLPFADLVGGELKALKSGIDAAATRLTDTDIPDAAKAEARKVLDAYEAKMKPDDAAAKALSARRQRLRLAEAEAA